MRAAALLLVVAAGGCTRDDAPRATLPPPLVRLELAERGYAGDADEAAPAAKPIDPRCPCPECLRGR